MSDHDDPPSPGPNDKDETRLTTPGAVSGPSDDSTHHALLPVDDSGLDMDLYQTNPGSSIVTMEPYSSPTRNSKVPIRKKPSKPENMYKNRIQILPGFYEFVSYNKFLIIRVESEVPVNINVFKGNREIVQLCGSQPKIQSQGDGSLFIETSSPEQSEALLKINKLAGLKVRCYPHPTFNQCRGVVYAPELLDLDCEEIQSELADQNVVKVIRMHKKINGLRVPLATLILTFDTFKLPNTIKAGWLNLRVKPYIPSPKRCFHCQMYGHLIQRCKKMITNVPAVCSICGQTEHGECSNPPSCIHCGEGHPSSSRNCIKFMFEKEIQATKVLEKVSFKEARRKVSDKYVRPGETFSVAMRKLRSDNTKPLQSIEALNTTQQSLSPKPQKSSKEQQDKECEKQNEAAPILPSTGTVLKQKPADVTQARLNPLPMETEGLTGKKLRENEDFDEDFIYPSKKQKSSKSSPQNTDVTTQNKFNVLNSPTSLNKSVGSSKLVRLKTGKNETTQNRKLGNMANSNPNKSNQNSHQRKSHVALTRDNRSEASNKKDLSKKR